MENRSVLAKGEGRKEGGCGCHKRSQRGPCGDGDTLYLDYGDRYPDLHIIKFQRTEHTQTTTRKTREI